MSALAKSKNTTEMKVERLSLFAEETSNSWQEEWQGMPEFVQERQKPFSSIIVRFETKEDMEEFSKLIGQKLTNKTKSIWHPQLVRGIHSNKRYVDES